jgi:hypothetical protein
MSWHFHYGDGSHSGWVAAGRPNPHAPPVFNMGPSVPAEPKRDATDEARLTGMARAFAQLTPVERQQLKHDDRGAYDAARSAWCKANGYPETIEREVRAGNRVMKRSGAASNTTPVVSRLKQQDPATFDRIRNDWLARGEPLE